MTILQLPNITNLISVSISGLLYGIFLVLFCASTYLMAHRQYELNKVAAVPVSMYRSPLFIGGIGLFAATTVNWIFIVYRSFMAFVVYDGGTQANLYYSSTSSLEAGRTFIWFLAMVLGDAIIIYHLWVIWDRNRYVIALPVLTLCASCVCCIAILYVVAKCYASTCTRNYDGGWVAADWVLSMCTNLYCCVLIIWRLWRINSRVVHAVTHSTSRNIRWVLSVFIESAALTVGWMVFFMLAFEFGAHLLIIAEEGLPPVIGIAFMLINLRIGMGYILQEQPSSSAFPSSRTNGISFPLVRIGHAAEDASQPAHIVVPTEESIGDVKSSSSVEV